MKRTHWILLLLIGMWMSSCGVSNYLFSVDKLMDVNQGMSKEQVMAILGKPDYRRFDEGMDEWEFRRFSMQSNMQMVIIVHFEDGKVVRMNSFEESLRRPAVTPAPPVPAVAPPVATIEVEPYPVKPTARLMNSGEFENFIDRLKLTFSGAKQEQLVKQMLEHNDVTTDQSVAILKEFFSSDQMRVAKLLYPYVRDKERYYNKVEKYFFFDNEKEQLRRFIESYHHNHSNR